MSEKILEFFMMLGAELGGHTWHVHQIHPLHVRVIVDDLTRKHRRAIDLYINPEPHQGPVAITPVWVARETMDVMNVSDTRSYRRSALVTDGIRDVCAWFLRGEWS
jgi:hypothetical protein